MKDITAKSNSLKNIKIKKISSSNNDKMENISKQENNDLNSKIQDELIIPENKRKFIFRLFLLSALFLNYDTGVIPAALIKITKEIDLDYSEQAMIGSFVYLGLSFASLFAGLIFSKYSPKIVCAIILILNSVSCFIFSFSSDKVILFLMRFFMGATGAFIFIYGPVWVNNFSPPEHSTTWMGILHSCSIFGVFLGYLVTAIILNFLHKFISWRVAIQIQGIVEIFLAFFLFKENEEYINVDTRKTIPFEEKEIKFDKKKIKESPSLISVTRRDPRIDTVELGNLGFYFFQAKTILKNKLYILITLAITSIYFIVTGIQFWITKYLIEILEVEPIVVNIIFSIISITAPLSGVLFGGTISDKYGGYKGKNETKALQMCSAFGLLTLFFGIPLGFMFRIIYLSVLLWAFLFFGAAIIPIATGIMISCVPKDCQATSSSISQIIFNLFGYFCSPMIAGFIMDIFEDEKQGFIWGMRLIFFWVTVALMFILSSYLVSYYNYKKYNNEDQEDSNMIEDSMEDSLSNFMKLEINRRLAQGSNFL